MDLKSSQDVHHCSRAMIMWPICYIIHGKYRYLSHLHLDVLPFYKKATFILPDAVQGSMVSQGSTHISWSGLLQPKCSLDRIWPPKSFPFLMIKERTSRWSILSYDTLLLWVNMNIAENWEELVGLTTGRISLWVKGPVVRGYFPIYLVNFHLN